MVGDITLSGAVSATQAGACEVLLNSTLKTKWVLHLWFDERQRSRREGQRESGERNRVCDFHLAQDK